MSAEILKTHLKKPDCLSLHSWNVAITWGRIISTLNLNDRATLLEIAPGHSPKVGFGLLLAHPLFCGTLYVLEPDAQALGKIENDYRRMFPNATIVGYAATLEFIGDRLPQGASLDLVLANHPLDDMIIGRDFVAGNTEFTDYFTGMYQDGATEAEKLANEAACWHALECGRPNDCARYKAEVVEDWTSFLSQLRPRFLVIAQYKSRTLQEYGVEAPDRLALDVLNDLAQRLPSMLLSTERILIDQGFDSKRWIVADLCKQVCHLPVIRCPTGPMLERASSGAG